MKHNETEHQLLIDFKKAYDSVKKEVLYNIFTGFCIPMKPVKLIKMCLNETYSKVCKGKHLSGMSPIQNVVQGNALPPLLFKFSSEYTIRQVQEHTRF
jgi:hypothetical protein